MKAFIFLLFIFWRVLLFLVAYFSGKYLVFDPSFPYSDTLLVKSGLPSWIWSFANFDGVHYLTIAKSGYSAQFTQVFFPVYPGIISLISRIIQYDNFIIIGLLLSNLFFVISLIILWKLLSLDYNHNVIIWTFLFLFCFPVSFYFGSMYTESLFFMLTLSTFYLARKRKWWLVGFIGALASATKLVGLFVLPAMIWELYQCNMSNIRNTKIRGSNISQKIISILLYIKRLFFSPVVFLIPMGLMLYMFYLQVRFGDWLYFWHAQPIFGAERTSGQLIFLPQVIWRYLKIFLTVSTYTEKFWIAVTEFSLTIIALALLVFAYKSKVRMSYIIFSVISLTVPTLTGTLSSMPRYILVIFPIYISLSLIKNKHLKYFCLLMGLVLLIVFTAVFSRGHWVS